MANNNRLIILGSGGFISGNVEKKLKETDIKILKIPRKKVDLKKDSSILEALNNNPVKGSTALHVRRGDYIKISENLSNDYYEKALEYAENNIKNFNYEIFSDDVDWVKKNNIFKSATKIQPFENSLENTKDSFANMMKNENFIISNSSFSLMAAFLNESKDSKVIFPDPWFRNQNYQKLSKKNWIPIVNN